MYTPRSISEIEILIIENIIATMETKANFHISLIINDEDGEAKHIERHILNF